jgi:hypothetical protein
MAAHKTDVNISGGFGGVTVVGITVNYPVGGIPTCFLDLAPGPAGVIDVSDGSLGEISNAESQKRKKDITVNVSVKAYAGKAGYTYRKLAFVGVLDGVNLSNAVGSNSYQAVLKSKAQYLREVTKITPGLYPSSINIYKMPASSMQVNPNSPDSTREAVAWSNIERNMRKQGMNPIKDDPIEYYTGVMRTVISLQQGGWEALLGREKMLNDKIPFKDIFSSESYKRALKAASALFNNVDLSGVTSGALSKPVGRADVLGAIKKAFVTGPNNLLDNYLSFLNEIGCTVIFSNNKMYVVPANSFIKSNASEPGVREMQSTPNHAGPADYNGYTYSDNGYRDIGHVIVLSNGRWGGSNNHGGETFDRMILGSYSAPNATGSGVLAVMGHPWMILTPSASSPGDARRFKAKAEGGDPVGKAPASFDDAVRVAQKNNAARTSEKIASAQNAMSEAIQAYAETKYYQAKYYDRMGSLNMDFNPQWVPGTGGTLYVRETGAMLSFYVTSVTHRIDTSAPSHGNASTTVNFCCGRIGTGPEGVTADRYLGYDIGKETNIQYSFISDIGGA